MALEFIYPTRVLRKSYSSIYFWKFMMFYISIILLALTSLFFWTLPNQATKWVIFSLYIFSNIWIFLELLYMVYHNINQYLHALLMRTANNRLHLHSDSFLGFFNKVVWGTQLWALHNVLNIFLEEILRSRRSEGSRRLVGHSTYANSYFHIAQCATSSTTWSCWGGRSSTATTSQWWWDRTGSCWFCWTACPQLWTHRTCTTKAGAQRTSQTKTRHSNMSGTIAGQTQAVAVPYQSTQAVH